MIRISSEDSKFIVYIKRRTLLKTPWHTLECQCGSDWAAELLAENLRDHLAAIMRSVREQSYREGWKDARAKRRCADHWSGELPQDPS